jgi:glycosyltransferase involved in cell wall biosynthesis
MLSIVIPTYNFNVFPLVTELYRQAIALNITFEIIVLDDASPDKDFIRQNNQINSLGNCRYELLPDNIGRSAIRNLLARQAKYGWLLYLDADTLPLNSNFIETYLPHLNDGEKVISGGIKYQDEKPLHEMLLRWVYGNEREALGHHVRNEAPYLSLLTLNFVINKSIFDKVSFNESIPNLRHEDTLFSYNLSRQAIKVEHINNPVYHLGLDTSEIFIKKSEESVKGLKYLLDNNLLSVDYIKLSKVYNKLNRFGLRTLVVIGFKLFKSRFRKNLLSSNPSLFIFDLYRLGYLCSLK